ncbi:MAG: glycoside hydrolase, partial [Oscillospiraceae bacterium]|nr:glycoside hydrolase [Oscillospiraceae bacterium]
AGDLLAPNDDALVNLARAYGVGSLLHLSTLTEGGNFSSERAAAVFADAVLTEQLAKNTAARMADGGYVGVDVDFEFLGAPLAQDYVAFLEVLHRQVQLRGGILVSALAPKTYAEQPGILYEGHDYAGIGANSDVVLVMTYEWGYTYGPPMAVAPLASVRRVLDYAVSEVPAEKLLLGFPNYAYDWALPYKAGDSRAELIGNEAAIQRAVGFGAEIRFDERSQTPYYYYTAPDGTVHEVWFEDARSALAKFGLISEYNLRGVGFWNYMRPFTAGFSLLNHLFSITQGLP